MHHHNPAYTISATSRAILAAVLTLAIAGSAMAGTLDFATRVSCELQTASGTSLQRVTWQQGTTPLLSIEQFRLGKAIAADTNTDAVVVIGPSATSQYYVAVTNQSTSGNSYLVQMPTIGTNTASGVWWYTVYFERDGRRYWTGNGALAIEATTSTGDGLVWQTITGVSVAALQSALDAEALARESGDMVAMTNWQAVVYSLTNGAALGETAWQNPASAADWTWTSNGREITLTGYSGPNAVVIPDMLDGLPVTGFGEVFTDNQDITSVGGGANIKAVGDYAFQYCGALSSVSLPACTTVGDYAFYFCFNLITVSLPACTTVGDYAFYGCGALSSVTFGQNAPAPADSVFELSTPTIYVSNPHATGWGETWNGRPVVRAASMADIASHNTDGTAHADIRALIPTLPGPGCTELGYEADGTNVTITGATYSYFFAPDKAYTLSVAPDAPRYHYSIEIIGDHACTLPAGHRLRGSWTITGTNEVVVAPSTGTVWNVFGRGL